jgi:prepilin-type N-terminal cleavage/methylation domain-containing protein
VKTGMKISTTGSLSSGKGQGTKGFTLIELAVVIALLGLFLGLTIPRFEHYLVADELKATTRKIVGLVREVRNEAIREQRVYAIHLDIESNRWWTEHADMQDEEMRLAKEEAFALPGGVRILDVWCRGKGKQAYGDIAIPFSKKGYVDQTLIHIGGETGREFTVELSPFLGVVKVHDSYVDVAAM